MMHLRCFACILFHRSKYRSCVIFHTIMSVKYNLLLIVKNARKTEFQLSTYSIEGFPIHIYVYLFDNLNSFPCLIYVYFENEEEKSSTSYTNIKQI